MVSREHKRETLHDDKLQLLRSTTNSHAINETTIVIDASKYIKELKHKVKILNQDIATSAQAPTTNHNLCPQVSVKGLEKGFIVNVHSSENCPGLLVSLLETFEELGLNVLEARVSCQDTFHLQAFGGGENEEEDEESISAQMVKRAISNAIKNWCGNNDR